MSSRVGAQFGWAIEQATQRRVDADSGITVHQGPQRLQLVPAGIDKCWSPPRCNAAILSNVWLPLRMGRSSMGTLKVLA